MSKTYTLPANTVMAAAFEQAKLVQIRPHPSKGAERVRRVERHRAAAAAKAEK